MLRKSKEKDRKRKAEETVTSAEILYSSDTDCVELTESGTSDAEDLPFETVQNKQTARNPRKKFKSASQIISPALAAALDRTNLSDRKATYVLSAAANTYADGDASVLPISVSSIRRSRRQHRTQFAATTKTEFSHEGALILHFDGKLLPAIRGGPLKEHRVAILVSGCEMEKLLGVPKVGQGTGKQLANVAHMSVLEWKIVDQVVGISFDTTAANTGRLNGACTLLELKMQKKLLWLACRHHVLEVVCGDVFKSVFGAMSAPSVPLFRRFQEQWPMIDQTTYEPCTDHRLSKELESDRNDAIDFFTNMLLRESDSIPREDYRELLELAILFLGKVPPRGVRFRMPGAFHHARWMAKLLYVLKLNLFRKQFQLTPRESHSCLEFGLFIALVYIRPWITCTNSCDAPTNDLNLVRAVVTYRSISEAISTAAAKAISRHLWYLSEELVPLSLFSDCVSINTKRQMAIRIREILGHDVAYQDRSTRCIAHDIRTLSNNSLESFIGPASAFFFSALRIDYRFLESDVKDWDKIESFQQARKAARALKVVNDCAERGIGLATTFNSSITKKEDQKQFLLQMVESHRKLYPNPLKRTLFPQ